jgi:hypothetical protein
MALFEQRISDEEIALARKKIAAGASLRSVAAEIPCAASTLSARIKKAEAAEASARGEAAGGGDRVLQPTGWPIAAGDADGDGHSGPIETLRAALKATKVGGQPDWATRISAARTLAALRPEELETKEEKEDLEPSIVVYDLPPGTAPVLHRAPESAEAANSAPAEPPVQNPTPSSFHMFTFEPPNEESVLIGMWSPPPGHRQQGFASLWVVHPTVELETAERWRAELSAGRLPEDANDVP